MAIHSKSAQGVGGDEEGVRKRAELGGWGRWVVTAVGKWTDQAQVRGRFTAKVHAKSQTLPGPEPPS